MPAQNFSRNSIADVRTWRNTGTLEIQPAFQRRAIWPEAAKIMLIDSILKEIPLPKIFVGTSIDAGNTLRVIVDGQQRITAILEFIDNKFKLGSPYIGEYKGLYFNDLSDEVKDAFLLYPLDFNEFQNWSDEDLRDVYKRVNKYNFSSNTQELRRADYPGQFLQLSEVLAAIDFFNDAKIFTLANRRRLLDVEYTSELLAILIDGVQDKKKKLDHFYLEYRDWHDATDYKSQFLNTIASVESLFPNEVLNISKTRFRQKSDFYSLFAATSELILEGYIFSNIDTEKVTNELAFLDKVISPNADGDHGEYAIRCVSDANSKSSRDWRKNFIRDIFLKCF